MDTVVYPFADVSPSVFVSSTDTCLSRPVGTSGTWTLLAPAGAVTGLSPTMTWVGPKPVPPEWSGVHETSTVARFGSVLSALTATALTSVGWSGAPCGCAPVASESCDGFSASFWAWTLTE